MVLRKNYMIVKNIFNKRLQRLSSNKKHHFVPKFYLKSFSDNGKNICIFNIPSEKIILDGKLKTQCYKNHFYGKEDSVEKSIGEIEGIVATLFKVIVRDSFIPKHLSRGHMYIVQYVVLQNLRTKYSSTQTNDFIDKSAKHLLKHKAIELGVDINNYKFGYENPVLAALKGFADAAVLTLDLKCKLLINKSNIDFITSDHPVVLYNQLLEYRKKVSNAAFGSKGLQIFLPIDSKHLLMLYDHKIYGVGNNKDNVVLIPHLSDIVSLNGLQIANAESHVYWKSSLMNIHKL